MPGYSRVNQYRSSVALFVEARDPGTGEMVATNVVQCDDCDQLTTAIATAHHDEFHEWLDSLRPLATAQEAEPTAPVKRPAKSSTK